MQGEIAGKSAASSLKSGTDITAAACAWEDRHCSSGSDRLEEWHK